MRDGSCAGQSTIRYDLAKLLCTEDSTDGRPSRIEMVMAGIKQRIAGRSLTVGEKLPSVRSLAKTVTVSMSTVVEAYARLVAEGAIHSRPGSGFYVASHTAPLALSEVGPKLDRAIDPFWVPRQSLEANDAALKPGCGWLPPSWLPEEAIRRALRNAVAHRWPPAFRIRHAARPASAAAAGIAATGGPRGRCIAGPDHADGKRHSGHRPSVPVSGWSRATRC